MIRHIVTLISIFSMLQLASCGQTNDELIQDTVLTANILLNSSQCNKAIAVLEGIGRQNKSAAYLKTLASAYACKSGYKTTTFFSSDISLFASPSLFGGSTRFSTSDDMTAPDSGDFENLQEAINILLYAGGLAVTKNPTITLRADEFSTEDAGDINAQLLYLVMVQMGKYLHFYGNPSTDGVKGGGTDDNKCLYTYDSTIALSGGTLADVLGVGTGDCDENETGNSNLGTGTSPNIERLCQGAVLLNNFFILVPEILSATSSTDLAVLSDVETLITTAKSALTTASTTTDVTDVVAVLSQTKCETDNTGAANALQLFFAFFYETLFV
jgi:hypothetical protein